MFTAFFNANIKDTVRSIPIFIDIFSHYIRLPLLKKKKKEIRLDVDNFTKTSLICTNLLQGPARQIDFAKEDEKVLNAKQKP